MVNLEEYETIRDRVNHVLFAHKETRSNDPLLYFTFLQLFHQDAVRFENGDIIINENKIRYLTSPDTIIRIRRKIQNEDRECLPDEVTEFNRAIRQRQFKQVIVIGGEY